MSTTKNSVQIISGDIAQVKEGIESLNEGSVNIVGGETMPE